MTQIDQQGAIAHYLQQSTDNSDHAGASKGNLGRILVTQSCFLQKRVLETRQRRHGMGLLVPLLPWKENQQVGEK